jgi:choline monooxygenase
MIEELRSFDPTLPLERGKTIPNTWYTDPAIYQLERRAVFGGNWLMIGRLDQVANPGSYLTANVAGEPLLAVLDEKGTLRAFYNVCRHRAAPIMNELCGTATKLRCRYHGWTYDLAGRLRGTPEFEGVADFDRDCQGLPEVAVATWGPLVWVHLGKPAQSVEEYLVPLPQWVADRRATDGLRFVRRQEYDVNCNWKVYVDNYLDGGYHVNTVHPALAGVLDYREYRTTIHGFTALQSSPIKPAEGDDQTTRTRTGDAAYWWVYPNFMVNLYAGVMDTNLVLPLGPDRCRVVFDFYFANPDAPGRDRFIDESVAVADKVQEEDMQICEEVQRGLNSRSYRTGRFSVKRELAGYYFHQLLGRQLQSSLPT